MVSALTHVIPSVCGTNISDPSRDNAGVAKILKLTSTDEIRLNDIKVGGVITVENLNTLVNSAAT